MAISNYNPASISRKHFIVNRKFIKVISDLFIKRFNTTKIDIEVMFKSGDDVTYENFEEFDTDIRRKLEAKESVNSILVYVGSANSKDFKSLSENYVIAYVKTDFVFPSLSGVVKGQNLDQTKKDFAIGLYIEMGKIFTAFDLSEEEKSKFELKYEKNTFGASILFDYGEPLLEPKSNASQQIQQHHTVNNNTINGNVGQFNSGVVVNPTAYVERTEPGSGKLYSKWWVKYLVFPVIVGLIIWYLTIGIR